MRKRLTVFSVLLLIFAALSAGRSYSWHVHREAFEPARAATAGIKTSIDFSLNTDRGIPGETVIISGGAGNTIKKEKQDYIFRLTYTVTFEENEPDAVYITDLRLTPASVKRLGLVNAGDYESDSRVVTYYGKHVGDEELRLGELLATFSKLKNPAMNKSFNVRAEIEACQMTEEASADIFGIDSTTDGGKYAGLFK